MSLTNCRFYEDKYPEVDSFVMVNVKQASPHVRHFYRCPSLIVCQIAEMGAYVKLLEYDNIDGMILLSELSRRRIRSIQKLIRVGRNEVVVVLRVDKEKGMPGDDPWYYKLTAPQVISIFQNVECLQRISSSARSDTTRERWCTRSYDTSPRRRQPRLKTYTQALVGL